ncbi:hypothetical protein [Streptomyces sp. NRRL F-5727]|uniref:hypothetical protein n=1 Tax=Streptomyces sp. NRRL F-5727 TaxID=1463871 RepID=UPI0004C88FBD|nr:hypothetical protein [Streptomyces sp. NRRL F-5727]
MGTPSAHPGTVRHHDHGIHLACFTGRILVVCPRCGGRALVVPQPGLAPPEHLGELLCTPRRLACPGCGAVADHQPERRGAGIVGARPGGTEDPFFRRPLWLQTRCAGRILWAYDEEHVDALAAYVGAHHRVRHASPTLSMFARLPAWMKSAQNRPEVLAGLATLRTLAALSAPADRSDAAHPRGDRSRHTGSLGFYRSR